MEITLLATMYVLAAAYAVLSLARGLLRRRGQCCYMLGYECYKAPEDTKLTTDECVRVVLRNKNLNLEDYRFLLKTMARSGIGEDSYGPRLVLDGHEEDPTLPDALLELDVVFQQTVSKVLASTGVAPPEIDILIVNVSLFSPAPSLTSRIVNHFKLRDDVKTFNLAGMGCSASLVAIHLVQELFKTQDNAVALVVSTESMGSHWYCGKEKSMIISNCLFRMGGCAVLLTNDRARAKDGALMKLGSSVRIHHGSHDESYGCCIQEEDGQGHQGFRLTKYLVKAAGQALEANLRILLPRVLPIHELVRYILANALAGNPFAKRKAQKVRGGPSLNLNLKSGIDHFCVHPGGKAVIDTVGKGLNLSDYDLEPSRMALHRFGNTSAGGNWYVLGYMEAKKRLKRGDTVLMISLGAGFKSNTCVWEVMRDLERPNVWADSVEDYPAASLENPFMDKYGWIYDDSLNFVRLEEAEMVR
ncbi:3-ketoacyl-CoA synthase 19-like [Rhodamnia argentea]|uniref:3-ketoacyl-CoA synthase n=1 Tax=Rhodamnia argentea TaxID=178133 RepID=A0A8B8MR20_9MYRT|nr:3-ketoacyl-CoA synthase 19-like [Rhodamnia argentea]